MKRRVIYCILFVGFGFLCGCQSPPPKPKAESVGSQITRNNCYALLYQLLNDEKDVSKLRFIKHEDADLKTLINRIAAAAREGARVLDEFSKLDRSLDLNYLHLPAGEMATRQDIGAEKQKLLLHGSGEDFEINLLLTQIEALNYGAHLAKVAGDNDFEPERKRYLAELSNALVLLHNETVGHLELRQMMPPAKR